MSTITGSKELKALMDKAFTQFNKKDYKKAEKLFTQIKEKHELEMWELSRVDQFLAICSKHTTQVEEKHKRSTMAQISVLMNQKKFDEALALIDQAELSKGDSLFLKAEMAAEQEDTDAAIDMIQKAIHADPRNRGYAINSPVFEPFLKHEAFAFLQSTTPAE